MKLNKSFRSTLLYFELFRVLSTSCLRFKKISQFGTSPFLNYSSLFDGFSRMYFSTSNRPLRYLMVSLACLSSISPFSLPLHEVLTHLPLTESCLVFSLQDGSQHIQAPTKKTIKLGFENLPSQYISMSYLRKRVSLFLRYCCGNKCLHYSLQQIKPETAPAPLECRNMPGISFFSLQQGQYTEKRAIDLSAKLCCVSVLSTADQRLGSLPSTPSVLLLQQLLYFLGSAPRHYATKSTFSPSICSIRRVIGGNNC